MTEEKEIKTEKHQKRFDRTFAEIVERYPQELIPIINEVFHTNYTDKEQVRLYRDAQHEKDGLIVTDSYFGIADSLYHIECQSIKDDEMAIRMIRYDFALAWKNAVRTETGYEMRFPESCVIYLRSTRNTPDKLVIKLLLPGGSKAVYETPVVKIRSYSMEEIFEKNSIYILIEELFQRINNYVTDANMECKERIGEVMRGNTFELESIKIWDEGHEAGRTEGIQVGIQEGRQEGIQEGRQEGISLGVARQLVRSVDNMVEKHGFLLEQACDYVDVTLQQYKKAKELIKENAVLK